MESKIKRLLVLSTSFIVILSVLGLVKYFNIGLGVASGDSCKLALTVPNLTHLSRYLDGGQYQFDIRSICLAAYLFMLISFRSLFLRKTS
jgi:hypothetical protein